MFNEVDYIYRSDVKFFYKFGWLLKEPFFVLVFFLRIVFISLPVSVGFHLYTPWCFARFGNSPPLSSAFQNEQPRRSGFQTYNRKTIDVFRFSSSFSISIAFLSSASFCLALYRICLPLLLIPPIALGFQGNDASSASAFIASQWSN